MHMARIYLANLKTVVVGLLQMLWKSARVFLWRIASAGSSPRRKYSAGTEEELLSFRKPLNILVWKTERDLTLDGLTGKADRPERRTGKLYIFQR